MPEAGLPAARVGIASGPVVWRDGDTFGRTVNVASRILGVAQPGQVLTTQDVATSTSRPALARSDAPLVFDDIGVHSLKGVADPLRLYRVVEGEHVDEVTARAT